jgi:DNA-binding response OmpR family regulator
MDIFTNIPFIFITVSISKNDILAGMEMQANNYIKKPLNSANF